MILREYIGPLALERSRDIRRMCNVVVGSQVFGDRHLVAAWLVDWDVAPSIDLLPNIVRAMEAGHASATGGLPGHPKLTWEF